MIKKIFALLIIFSLPVLGWDFSGWEYRKTVEIDTDAFYSEDLPVLLEINDADLGLHANADGSDIIFAMQDGTQLAHEIESFSGDTAFVWVTLPSDILVDSTIYMYYGNAAADPQEDPAVVWSLYSAVYHMFEDFTDSIGTYDAAFTPSVAFSDGIIDNSAIFNGAEIATANQVFTDETEFTAEAWVRSTDNHGYIFKQRNSVKQGILVQQFYGELQFYIDTTMIRATITPGVWHHVLATYEGGTAYLYVDGILEDSSAASLTWPAVDFIMGSRDTAGRELVGDIDEVRIMGIAVDADYALASYEKMNAVLALGTEETDTPSTNIPPAISGVQPVDAATDVELTPSLIAAVTDNGTFDVTVEYDDAGWTELHSDTYTDSALINLTATFADAYSTTYSWRITADDGEDITQETYTFTTLNANIPPTISNVTPVNGATDVELAPSIGARIIDDDDEDYWYTFDLLVDGNWTELASGSKGTIQNYYKLVLDEATEYSTEYTWRLTVTDGEDTVQETYSFTTMDEPVTNEAPVITDMTPADGAIDVSLAPTLSVAATDDGTFDVTIEIDDGGWTEIHSDSYTGSADIDVVVAAVTAYSTAYDWRVTADDGEFAVQETYSFTTMDEPIVNTAPVITNSTPDDAAIDVALSPEIGALVTDDGAHSILIEIMEGGNWTELLSNDTTGQGFHMVTAPATDYSTTYDWRITADDGEFMVQEAYSFTTMDEPTVNTAPVITSMDPTDGETNVLLAPTLAATVNDDGEFNVKVEIDDGGWIELFSDNFTGTADIDVIAATVDSYSNGYGWRITADDGEFVTQETYSFTTIAEPVTEIAEKFTFSFDNDILQQIFPLSGDVDADGENEIIFNGGSTLYVIDGTTGDLEWSLPGTDGKAIELVDLDNDGTPEIIHGTSSLRVQAVEGDGTIRWTSDRVSGVAQALFPIVAGDIDGDNLPEIYYAASDAWPDPYNGNIEDYTGTITMLDNEGNILRSTWIIKPCWSGMALGDTDFDGEFELYLGDRRDGYHGLPANGLQKFNAHTLEPIWERPDLQHSSPMPHLVDVIGDSVQEVIGEEITLDGPLIIDPENGESIIDYSDLGLPTHATATIVDIDEDGNQEMFFATGYPSRAPRNFVVFDLVEGKKEFEPTFDYHLTWAPSAGDVLGDRSMEILAAAGNQGGSGNYPLLIYDKDYNLVKEIEFNGFGQLMPARVFDTDNDGMNEIVVVGLLGKLAVFDTGAITPDPAPRSWVQWYSEARLGAAEYVPFAGPDGPIVKNVSPDHGATVVTPDTDLSVYASDVTSDTFDITFEIDDGSGYTEIITYYNQTAGNFKVASGALDFDKTYDWKVTVVGDSDVVEKVFTFYLVEEDTLLKDSDFELSGTSVELREDSLFQDWYESRYDVPTLVRLDEINIGGNDGKKAAFDASPTGNAYLSQEFNTPQSGNFSVEWDIYVDEILNISGNPDRAGLMMIGDSTDGRRGPNSGGIERYVYMAFAKDGGGTNGTMDLTVSDRDDAWTSFTTVASGLNLDQWYNIRVDLDLDSDTYDIYVDDVFQATVTSDNVKDSVTHISFAQWNDGAGTFYIDNVNAY